MCYLLSVCLLSQLLQRTARDPLPVPVSDLWEGGKRMSRQPVDQIAGDQRPNLFLLWIFPETHVDADELCKPYSLNFRPLHVMLRNRPVWLLQAKRILAALSHMMNKPYSLETVKVLLIDEENPHV